MLQEDPSSRLVRVAFFDVDNTIIHGQSQQLFINYLRKTSGISLGGWMKLNLFFIIYKLGFESDMKRAFEEGLKYFISKKVEDIDIVLDKFSSEVLSKRVSAKALDKINELKRQGYSIVLFSAAAEPIVRRVLKMVNADDSISTVIEINPLNNTYSGKIVGEPNYGVNKSLNASKYARDHNVDLTHSYAYSDHISDLPLLKLVGRGFLVNSTNQIKKGLEKRGLSAVYF